MTGPVTPGGQEVPTLNNLGLGMSAAEVGPPGMPPSLSFVQDHTRQMIQQNSDYKLPHSGSYSKNLMYNNVQYVEITVNFLSRLCFIIHII